MIGLTPCVTFAQAGLPQHHVNAWPPRPVCVIHAPFLNWWNAAGGKLITIEPPTGVVTVLSGPVILKLVASSKIGVAFGTCTAATYELNGRENTFVGILKLPPTPAPVVVIFLPATLAT